MYRSKREEAYILSKKLHKDLFNDDKHVSTLLLGCKTVCMYLGISSDNRWIEDELSGYDPTTFSTWNEMQNRLPDYRKVTLVYYDFLGRPILGMPQKLSDLVTDLKIPNSITDIETSQSLTILSFPTFDLINQAIGSKTVYIHNKDTAIRSIR